MVLFFLTSRKNAAGPKGQAFEAVSNVTRGSASEQWAPKRPGDAHLTVSIRNRYQSSQRPCSSIYVCIDICIYIHRYIHTNSNVYIYIYVDQYITYSFTLLCSLSYICIHTYIHTFRYEHSPRGGGKESGIH